MEIKGNSMLRRSKPIGTPARLKYMSKYYEYHKDCGHTTFE